MNPDSPKTPREEMETWLTSLLLGELSAGEAAAVRELIKHDSELAKLHDDLKATIQLVRQAAVSAAEPTAATPDQPKLSTERREKLLAQFMTVAPKELAPAKRHSGIRLLELAAVLAILAILSAMMLPALSKAKSKAQSVTVLNNLRQLEAAKEQWALENKDSGITTPTFEDIKPYLGGRSGAGMSSVAGETYVLGKVGEPPSAEIAASDAKKTFKRFASTLPSGERSDRVRLSADGKMHWAGTPPLSATTVSGRKSGSDSATVTFGALSLPAGESPAREPAEHLSYYSLSAGAQNYSASAAATPPPTPPTATPIVLPAITDTDSSSPASRNYAVPASAANGTIFAGGQFTDLPAKSPAQQLGDFVPLAVTAESAAEPARFVDPATGLPVAATRTDDTKPKLEMRQFAVNSEALHRALGTASASDEAFRRRYSPDSGLQTIPRASVVGQVQGGGGGGGGGGGAGAPSQPNVVPPAVTETTPSAGSLALSDTAGVTVKTGEGKSGYFAGGQTRGTTLDGANTFDVANREGKPAATPPIVTLHAQFAETEQNERLGRAVDSVAGKSTVLGDEPVLGEIFTNSSALNGQWTDNSQDVKQGGVLSSGGVAVSKLRETILGYKVAEEQLAKLQKDSAASATDLEQAQKQVTELEKAGDQGGRVLRRQKTESAKPKAVPIAQANQEALEIDKLPAPQAYARNNSVKFVKGKSAITRKLEQIQVDSVMFDDVPLTEVMRKLSEVARKHDPDKNGINFVINPTVPAGKNVDIHSLKVHLNPALERVRLIDVLDAVSKVTDVPIKLSVEDYGVVFSVPSNDEAGLPREIPPLPVPQPEIQTSENNFSTFSLNVSDVSFKLAAASLEKGQMPDPASVRSEEFINAFDYRDPEPQWDSASSLSAQAGRMPAPLAFAWERARYPFTHNRDLLRFSIKTAAEGRINGRPLNLVLLLDNSGSMERADRVRIIREALRVLAGQLQPQDKLSVITFARTPRLVADGISGDRAGEVTEAVSGLTPEGGTNLEEAMNLGYQTAARHYVIAGINRVVVLTDGAANLGDVKPESLKQKVEDARKQGIALDCFGIGWEGFNDDLLEVLSRNGDGRYGFINSPEEAATEFAGQLAGALKVAASDVKVQVEFNPRRVTSYRQIGYAKHQLTKEQFRDNTVDAAEIAAQEAGNALYTVEVNPAGHGPLCTVRVRYKLPVGTSSAASQTSYREQAWDVPYTGNAPALEQSSPAMRLAASAAAFSEWLVASPFASEVTPDRVLSVLSGVPEVFGADSRPKTLEWMIRQARSIEGK